MYTRGYGGVCPTTPGGMGGMQHIQHPEVWEACSTYYPVPWWVWWVSRYVLPGTMVGILASLVYTPCTTLGIPASDPVLLTVLVNGASCCGV